MRITDAIDTALWAMEPAWLETIRSIALGEGEGPEAVAARLGRPLQNAQKVTMRDGVAVIPITGPIFRYANLFTEVSGASSIEIFARDLRTALDDPSVKAIVLEINSPGGQVDGINEAANMIRAGAAEKPIVSYVSGLGASAGYWLAAAAPEVVIDATAQLGSIGVVTTIMKRKAKSPGAAEEIEIVSSQSPNKRPDPETDAGRAQIQARVDALADVFISAIAEFRGVEREDVVSRFGAGGVTVGQSAVELGMADRQGSLEAVIAELASGDWQQRSRRMKDQTYTQAELDEKIAAARAEALEQGKAEADKAGIGAAVKAERERIAGIEKISLPGHEKLAAEAKANGTSIADFAVAQAEAEKAIRESHFATVKADAAKVIPPAAPSVSGDPAPAAVDPSLPLEERCKAKWDADAELRARFGDNFGWYLSAERAEASGKVRTISKRAS